LQSKKTLQFLRRMVFDEGGSGAAAGDGETVASVLGCCVFVRGADVGDDELLDGIEELVVVVSGWIFI
jgi:hypothetical protein